MAPRDPTDVAAYDEELARITIGGPRPLTKRIELRDYDPAWPLWYEREQARIRSILGERVIRIEHVGSTAVPGLAAKSTVDIALEVPDSADEPAWFEHRLFKGLDANVNLHVFTAGCAEVDRMLLLRDRLRANAADREFYAAAKRELAARDWKYGQQYADAKTAVIAEIIARAEAARSCPAYTGCERLRFYPALL